MEQETKILLGVTAVGVAIAGYFWWKKLQAVSAATPALPAKQVTNAGVFSPSSGNTAPNANSANGVQNSPGSASAPPSAARYFSTIAMPLAMSPVATTPSQTPLPQDGNYVQTSKGLFTWAQGGSYDAGSGVISNPTSGQITITTPSGPLTLSSGMTYNVNTGEIGF
jgi:hypothetical protein